MPHSTNPPHNFNDDSVTGSRNPEKVGVHGAVPRDFQRSKVIRAEFEVMDPIANEQFGCVADIWKYRDRITKSAWWQRYRLPECEPANRIASGHTPPAHVTVTLRYGRKTLGIRNGEIDLPRRPLVRAEIIHALAHAIQTEMPWHGRQYTRISLDLTKRWLGANAYRQLRAAYHKHKVKVGIES